MEKPQVLWIVAMVIYLLALVLFLCGFAGDYWIDADHTHQGLWKFCFATGDCVDVELKDQKDWFKATVAMMILAIICAIIGGLAMICLLVVSAGLQGLAGLCTLIAIIIYGVKVADADLEDKLGWSFIMATISGILFLFNALFVASLAKRDGFSLKPKIAFRT